MGIEKCKIIDLPKIANASGNLTYIEGNKHAPFEIKRIFYLYDVPCGAIRGRHAHKTLEQVIIALSGSFDLFLSDGYKKVKYRLNRTCIGVYICPMVWSELSNFSSGSVVLVLASKYYNEDDYIRDYDQFLIEIKEGKG
jgi:uncharacterized RmlC-like cupin family protein